MKMRPLVVIGLILAVLGLVALAVPSFTFFTTERLADVGFLTIDISRPHTIVFNPIVGGVALKGPTVEMMRAVGPPPTPGEVARLYREVAATFVLDSRDRELARDIEAIGLRALVIDTVMADGGGGLAARVLEGLT